MISHGVDIPPVCEPCPSIAPNIQALEQLGKFDVDTNLKDRIVSEISQLIVEDCAGAYPDENRPNYFYCGRFKA